MQLPACMGAQPCGQFHAFGRLLAHQQCLAAVVGVLGGDVLARDVEGRHGGRAFAAPEVQLAAYFVRAACGQLGVVAHVGKGGSAQNTCWRIGRRGVLRVQVHARRHVPHQAHASGGGLVAAGHVGGAGGRDGAAIGEVQRNAFVPQRGYQLQCGCQGGAVFQVHGGGRDLVVAVRLEAGLHARDVEEILGGEVVGVHRAHGGGQAVGEACLPVHAEVQPGRPVAAPPGQGAVVVGFQAVANHLVVMPLQQHARAGHRRVGGIEGVGFDVAVVA